ncbi:MAG: Asp23/Gls24 family envelope stress response protein [Chloroflexota bacterium]
MEVYALVGPSGTGKSHHAMIVANDNQIDLIVDDGLLIADGKIVCGQSAKRETTRVAAVRRAIFADAADAAAARDVLARLSPGRVLILGTSQQMIDKIRANLALPELTKLISIDQVASPAEIRRALRARRERGRHVIPAPTLEVKKTFSGYLIDPLKLFIRSKNGVETRMLFEKSVVRPTYSSLGRFYIDDIVIIAIAARAARSVEGIRKPGRATLVTENRGVTINMDVTVKYGCNVNAVLAAVQKAVRDVVEHMTALNVLAVNVVARHMSYE